MLRLQENNRPCAGGCDHCRRGYRLNHGGPASTPPQRIRRATPLQINGARNNEPIAVASSLVRRAFSAPRLQRVPRMRVLLERLHQLRQRQRQLRLEGEGRVDQKNAARGQARAHGFAGIVLQ